MPLAKPLTRASPSSWPTYRPARQFGVASRSVPAWKPVRRPLLVGETVPPCWMSMSVESTRAQARRSEPVGVLAAPFTSSSPTRLRTSPSIARLPWRSWLGSAA
ncbi:hypothetical protein D9M72_462350 [compost metagenome]